MGIVILLVVAVLVIDALCSAKKEKPKSIPVIVLTRKPANTGCALLILAGVALLIAVAAAAACR